MLANSLATPYMMDPLLVTMDLRRVCQAVATVTQGLPAMLERMGRLVCMRGCTKQCYTYPLFS